MSQNRTEKCCFQSRYGGGWITPAQFLTEQLCIKIAQIDKKDLPDKFWELPEWNKIFRRHIVDAHKLLKIYYIQSALAALKDKSLYKIYSFRFPPFITLIKKYQKQFETTENIINQNIEDIEEQPIDNTIIRPIFTKNKSSISKLR
jgi:hypothetical protein